MAADECAVFIYFKLFISYYILHTPYNTLSYKRPRSRHLKKVGIHSTRRIDGRYNESKKEEVLNSSAFFYLCMSPRNLLLGVPIWMILFLIESCRGVPFC